MSRKKNNYATRQVILLIALILISAAAIGLLIMMIGKSTRGTQKNPAVPTQAPTGTQTANTNEPGSSPEAFNTENATEAPTAEPTKAPAQYNAVAAADTTKASSLGFTTEILAGGNVVDKYTSEDHIEFLHDSEYSQGEGVLSFRGSCFRRNPFYGTAKVDSGKLRTLWNHETYSLGKGEGGNYSSVWTGSGWTGQALTIRWDDDTKAAMNLYDSAKAKEGLIEVIYPTMDGNIYFYDIETGEPTRDKLVMGVPFKGSGSVDPRGWPILYVGQGDHYSSEGKASKIYIISLIDCKVLATVGAKPDSFALRTWHAYDSAAVVDANTDTLFYPGENGILYRVKLNTQYDKVAGTLSMNPSAPVKVRYQSTRTKAGNYWLGYEASAVAWREYLYLCDNAGFMQCVDANTMETVWVQDIWDDTNATPCLEEDPENKTAYLYVGNTLDNKADASGKGDVAFFKIDACTGNIVWEKDYTITTTSKVTGGFQGSALLGEGEIDGLVITTYCSTGTSYEGIVVAYDTKTGDEVWTFKVAGYTWCSPVALYDENGKAYIIVCNCIGDIYVLDGHGQQLDKINVESNIEASPVAFDNYIVIGTRVKGIFGLKIY
ncbi:MAG: PQQ-binding-like beta-propeller repeat protein [Clostridia bacterium]|nr:PQQ-binding-like beta-propeller repeat protein [Clostridia bacterium]